MNILYIETKAIIKRDIERTLYFDNANKSIIDLWDKYKNKCDNLIVLIPYEKKFCTKNQKDLIKIGSKYALEDRGIELEKIKDLFDYETNRIDDKVKNDIIFLMERNICRSDVELIVINSEGTIYKQIAVDLCNQHNKKYILENNNITI